MAAQGYHFRLSDVPGVKTPAQTTIKLPIHPEVTGVPDTIPLSILWVVLPPGTSTGRHCHETSDEYEFVGTGSGILDAGDEKGIPVGPEMLVYNPKGLMHEVKNTGKETLTLLRVHVPPLPARPGTSAAEALKVAKAWFAGRND